MKRIEKIFRAAEIILHSISVMLLVIIAWNTTNTIVAFVTTIVALLSGQINIIEIFDFLKGMRKK